MVFFGKDSVTLPGGEVVVFNADADWIQVAYLTLSPLLGTAAASLLFCRGAPCQRAEQHDHGYAGRPGRDGGLHGLANSALAAPVDHPPGGIVPAIFLIGVRGDSGVNDLLPQPGGAGHPVAAGHVSTPLVHGLPEAHGILSQRALPRPRWLGLLPAHHRA